MFLHGKCYFILDCNIADLDELGFDENNNVVHTENVQNEVKQVNTYIQSFKSLTNHCCKADWFVSYLKAFTMSTVSHDMVIKKYFHRHRQGKN